MCTAESLKLLLETIRVVCKDHVDNKDSFNNRANEGVARLVELMASPRCSDTPVLSKALELTSTLCARTENNKVAFMRAGIAGVLMQGLQPDSAVSVLRNAATTVKALTNADDTRREISCALDNSKVFVSSGAVPLLIGAASRALIGDGTDGVSAEVAAAAFGALKQLAITAESVNVIALHGQ
jgi:hypothetical protein